MLWWGWEVRSAVRPRNPPILFLGSREKFNNFEAFHVPKFVSALPGYGDTRLLVNDLEGVVSPTRRKGKRRVELLALRRKKGSYILRDVCYQFQTHTQNHALFVLF